MKAPIAWPWSSVNGPRLAAGDRRQACARVPKVFAQAADSEISSAPCWLIGATTRDCTADGSTGRCRPGLLVVDEEAEGDQQVERSPHLTAGLEPGVALLQAVVVDGLLVERGRALLEERTLVGTVALHRTASFAARRGFLLSLL